MRTTLLASLLLLAACGGGSASDPYPPDLKITVVLDPALEPTQGWYADGVIRVGGFINIAPLLGHELGHAMGLPHQANRNCVMNENAPSVGGVACPEDVAGALGAPFPMTVISLLPDNAAIGDAIEYWNRSLGREQFVLEP